MTYKNVIESSCTIAAQSIRSAFTFGDSPEGFEFWHAVTQRLSELGVGDRPTTPCLTSSVIEVEALKTQVAELRKRLFALDFTSRGR